MKKKLFALALTLMVSSWVRSQCAIGNCSLYTVSSIPYSLSPAGGTNLILSDDQLSAALPIGFTFSFMCNVYTTLYVSSNGYLSFNPSAGNGCCQGQTCPTNGGVPNNYVAIAWTDLYPPGAGFITYQTQGVAPNRVFVLTYSNTPYCCGAVPALSGQIKLFESTGDIEVHTTSLASGGNNRTQGIMNQAGTAGFPSPGRNANTWTVLTPDAYRWSVPTSSILGNASICPGATTVYSISPVPAALSYSWNLPAGWTGSSSNHSISATPGATGVLTLTSTYTCGIVTQTLNVTVNSYPIITVNSGSICSGNSFTMVPSGAVSYTFQGGNAVVSPTVNTSYTVVGTNSAGCISQTSATSNIVVHQKPIITVNSGSICSGNSFTMVPSGASTYTFQGGSAVVSPTANSSYTVVGTSTAGCVSQSFATSNVTVHPKPIITVNSGSICAGNSFTMVPSGANTYTFQGGSAVVSPTVTSSYTVTGTSTAGCVSQTFATSTVTVHAKPIITVNSGSICSGNSFTMVPSGANTYTFQGGSAIVSPGVSSTYTVAGTSTAGCASQSFATSSVTVSQSPTVTVNSGSICSGNSFTIIPSGANTYTIQGGNAVVSPNASSNYTVAGTNTAGCVSQVVVSSVTVENTPTITVNSGSICVGNSFTMMPSGANSYTFEGGSAVVSPSTNTSYTVAGMSAGGCPAQSTATSVVSVDPSPLPVVSVNSGSICSGESFTMVPSGANTYTFQGGSAVVSPTANSSYTVIGSTAAGCVSQNFATSNITVSPAPMVNIAESVSICPGETATLTASGADTYSWNTGANTAVITVSPASTTTYSVLGTLVATGCSASKDATVTVIVCTNLTNVGPVLKGLAIYPNPGHGEFTVELKNGLAKTIEVTDYTGKLVYSISSSKDIINVNINNLADGLYNFKIISSDGTQDIKVLKQ